MVQLWRFCEDPFADLRRTVSLAIEHDQNLEPIRVEVLGDDRTQRRFDVRLSLVTGDQQRDVRSVYVRFPPNRGELLLPPPVGGRWWSPTKTGVIISAEL